MEKTVNYSIPLIDTSIHLPYNWLVSWLSVVWCPVQKVDAYLGRFIYCI